MVVLHNVGHVIMLVVWCGFVFYEFLGDDQIVGVSTFVSFCCFVGGV